jgi:nucleotide-binding universal stress UspA family protein
MKLENIIVATDFSPQSDSAIRHGCTIAGVAGAAIRVVHVVETPADEEGLEAAREAVRQWHVTDEGKLAREIEACSRAGMELIPETVEATSTAEGLQRVVDEHGVGLVVVGSTGSSGIKQALLGSTASKVLRAVEAHVLVARGDAPPAEGYQRVLLPTDFSEPAEKALELAQALSAPGAQLDLVHFWRVPEATRGDEHSELVIRTVSDSVKERGRKLLESVQQRVPSATFTAIQSSPERGISQKLEEGDYDLVAVGSYGRSKLRRWLLGGVAEYTARTAPCAVAVARPE